jgi:hypothetical protein
MASGTEYRGASAAAEREHHRGSPWHQAARFIGLFLSPFAGLLGAWLIHLWIGGLHLHSGHARLDQGDHALLWLIGTLAFILLATGLSTWLAWEFAEHRKTSLRASLAASVALVGAFFALNVATGPGWRAAGSFIIATWAVATVWSLARLDVTRNNKRTDGEQPDGFWERLGVDRGTKLKAKVAYDEHTGEAVRLDVDVDHVSGESADVFREGGLTKMESAAAAPRGMSSVSGNPDRADRSTVSIPLVDPFKRPSFVGPLSAPGKSIGEWTTVADYANGRPARFTIGNGVHTPTPTSYGLIGMTRAGKTGTETEMLTDWGSRRDWVCLYLNQAKGLQDAHAVMPIFEAMMIADDEVKARDDARVAVKQIRNIMAYRQRQLSTFAVSAWSPRCADPDESKRPSRHNGTGRVYMEAMPMLTMHIGEADSLLSDGRIGDDVIFIGSKGLSLGVNVGISLQKPDFRSMPTNLRSQIGLWFVHGLAQSDDEEYLIETSLRKSGVNPGQWGQRKPGQHYMIGANVEDESLYSVALKTRFIIDSETDERGRPYSFDERNDRFMAEMLRRNIESARTQARLDRGSADETGGWWDERVARAAELRSATPTANPQPQTANPAPEAYVPPAFRGRPQPDVAEDEPTAEETQEMHEEAATVTEVEGIDLYPDGEGADVDLTWDTAPLPDPAPEDDPLYDPEEDERPRPQTRAEAIEALADALGELLADPSLRDPRDPEAVIIGPGMVYERYRFLSRPWFSAELSALAEGESGLADRFVLTLAEDLGIRKGKYRLRRVSADSQ